MPRRRERVAPPPAPAGWDFRYASNDAAAGWQRITRAVSANARVAWDVLTTDPRRRDSRQHPLKGKLGTRLVDGDELEQWQYEVTGGGRLWYCIDDKRRTVWLTEATVGHPKATE